MLKPTKYMQAEFSVIGISTKIIEILQKERIIYYAKLVIKMKEDNENYIYNLSYALQFLFLLGIIDYHAKTDSIEYLPSET